jgi:hypothetical protein
MDDETLRKMVQDAPLPEPQGGLENARERMMGRVRQQARETTKKRPAFLRRLLPTSLVGGGVLVAGIVTVLLLSVPNTREGKLPSEQEMQLFYDLHNVHAQSHFTQIPQDATE